MSDKLFYKLNNGHIYNLREAGNRSVEQLAQEKSDMLLGLLRLRAGVGKLQENFRSLRIGLLDYMAVIPYRRGIGEDLFKFTFEKFGSLVSNGIGLLMEIQRQNVLDSEESLVRKNRIRFYTLSIAY